MKALLLSHNMYQYYIFLNYIRHFMLIFFCIFKGICFPTLKTYSNCSHKCFQNITYKEISKFDSFIMILYNIFVIANNLTKLIFVFVKYSLMQRRHARYTTHGIFVMIPMWG
jgi:hypothetical protein